jgi:hypothetical protein
MTETAPDEIESSEEFVFNDNEVTLWDEWDEDEHIAPGAVRIKSVGRAIEEEREVSEEVFQQFSRTVLGKSSDSPQASKGAGESNIRMTGEP